MNNRIKINELIDGRYRILRHIGKGGMADVYLAHDEYLNRDVSFKTLKLDYQNDVEAIERFNQEATAAASISHPNIVQIYDFGEWNDIKYIVLEYVSGTDLKTYIDKHFPIAYQEVIDIMAQILSAIEAAHTAGIIHRDIKTRNILLSNTGQVKITDFGIALLKHSDYESTDPEKIMGSIHYLSPEQVKGEKATVQSDIYALGVILYELLTNSLPYEGDSAVSVALKHAQDEMPSVRNFDPRIPQSLENVILKATTKNPEDRYASVQDMQDDLETVLSPRRANEAPYRPTISPIDDVFDETATRIIPIEEVQKQLASGVGENQELKKKVVEDETPTKSAQEQLEDQVIEQIKKGYTVAGIAKALGLKKKTVKDILSKNNLGVKNTKKTKIKIIAGVIAALVLIPFLWMMFTPQLITVPNLKDMSQAEAEKTIQLDNLQVGEITEVPSKTVKKGYVIKTTPRSGARVKKGTTINLIISSGKKTIRFGDYIGMNYDTVAKQLRKQGYTVKKKEQADSVVPEGQIIDQSVDSADQVTPDDTTVIFTVSSGSTKVTVPNFVNQSKDQVQSWADNNNITVTFNTIPSDSVKAGLVISQTPRAGTKITSSTTVLVFISNGITEDTNSSNNNQSQNDNKSDKDSNNNQTNSNSTNGNDANN